MSQESFFLKKSAFTLIELLVVIAIIAILAAILFPVFAQAKTAAKKSTSISNLKQIGLAQFMYMNDYEDRFPTSYFKRFPGDLNFWVQPYMKNLEILLGPGRNISPSSLATVCGASANDAYGTWFFQPGGEDNPTNLKSIWGYGFNVGFNYDNNTGLVRTGDVTNPDGNSYTTITIGGNVTNAQYRRKPKVGINQSAVAAPASVLMEGETSGLPFLNISMDDLRTSGYVPESPCEAAARSGSFSFGGYDFLYCDGHVKYSKFNTGLNQNGYMAGSKLVQLAVTNPCSYVSSYDGGNNPENCQNGFMGSTN